MVFRFYILFYQGFFYTVTMDCIMDAHDHIQDCLKMCRIILKKPMEQHTVPPVLRKRPRDNLKSLA